MRGTPISNPLVPVVQNAMLHRQALIEKLQPALQQKLTLIAAPPGYGKTSLVAQLAHQVDMPVAWHTLDQSERDMAALHTHSLAVWSRVLSGIEGIEISSSTSPEDAAVRLVDGLRQVLKQDVLYVLDDVHHVLGFPGAEKWLRTLVTVAPPELHLVLIGRALPPLPLMELVVHGQVLALGQEQLRFSFDEVDAFARQVGLPKSSSEIQQLMDRFDGWIAGTALALQPLPAEIQSTLFDGKSGPEAMFDALAEVLFRAQEASIQAFLVASSTLAQMTPVLCQEILQLPRSREQLEQVLALNLFTLQVAGGVQFHPLFRSFLQRCFKRQDPLRFARLHEEAGRWFEAHHRLDEAFDHYVAAAQYPLAAALAERAAQVYFAAGKLETVRHWRRTLEGTGLAFPMLRYTTAMIDVSRYAYRSVDDELSQAEQEFQAQQDDLGTIKVRLLQAHVDYQRGENQQAIQHIEALLHAHSLPANLLGNAYFILGSARANLGDTEQALRHLQTALPLYRDAGDGYSLSQLLLTLEYVHTRRGEFDAGFALLQEAIQIRRDLKNRSSLVSPLNNLGWHYHMLGEYERASETFREALDLCDRTSDPRSEGYLRWSLGDLYRDRGAFDEAEAHYQEGLRLIGADDPTLRASLLLGLATLQRWTGALDEAFATATSVDALAETHQLPFERAQAQLILQTVRPMGDPHPELIRLVQIFQAQGAVPQAIGALVLCAAAALLSDDQTAAYSDLRAAVDFARHPTHRQPALAEILHQPPLLAFLEANAARFPDWIEGIRRLQAAQLKAAPAAPSEIKPASSTMSLRIWGLGQTAVERDGSTVPLSAWRAKDARELFVYLLLKGPASRDQLGLILWEDSALEQMRLKFHSTLHRLRDAVGTNAVRFEDDLYFVNPELDLWCDALEFRSLVQQARLSSPLRALTETLWSRADELYQGELFPEIDAPWIASLREALLEMHLETLLGLGQCLRARGDTRGAIEVFQRGLGLDAYREDFHRALLQCYADLGDHPRVHRHLEALKFLFQSDLGIQPSTATLTLAKSLLK